MIRKNEMKTKHRKYHTSYTLLLMIIISVITISSCSDDSVTTGTPCTVRWDASREKAVNSPGGGYHIYYSMNSDFAITDTDVSLKDVPFISGDKAPVTTEVRLEKGSWHFKITAYSALDGGRESEASDEFEIEITE